MRSKILTEILINQLAKRPTYLRLLGRSASEDSEIWDLLRSLWTAALRGTRLVIYADMETSVSVWEIIPRRAIQWAE